MIHPEQMQALQNFLNDTKEGDSIVDVKLNESPERLTKYIAPDGQIFYLTEHKNIVMPPQIDGDIAERFDNLEEIISLMLQDLTIISAQLNQIGIRSIIPKKRTITYKGSEFPALFMSYASRLLYGNCRYLQVAESELITCAMLAGYMLFKTLANIESCDYYASLMQKMIPDVIKLLAHDIAINDNFTLMVIDNASNCTIHLCYNANKHYPKHTPLFTDYIKSIKSLREECDDEYQAKLLEYARYTYDCLGEILKRSITEQEFDAINTEYSRKHAIHVMAHVATHGDSAETRNHILHNMEDFPPFVLATRWALVHAGARAEIVPKIIANADSIIQSEDRKASKAASQAKAEIPVINLVDDDDDYQAPHSQLEVSTVQNAVDCQKAGPSNRK